MSVIPSWVAGPKEQVVRRPVGHPEGQGAEGYAHTGWMPIMNYDETNRQYERDAPNEPS